MPSGRNSVYGPAVLPVFDPEGIRAPHRRPLSGPNTLPPYSVTGFVNGTGESPSFPVRTPGTITSSAVTVDATGGTSIEFDIIVNGIVVNSHTASTAGLTIHVENFVVIFNDLVSVAITDCGSGDMFNFLVVLRQ